MPSPLRPRGQAAAEFLLVAPLLFLIFFGIVQLAYFAYGSLAVQRAAYAAARGAACSADPSAYDPRLQLAYCLAPLAQLNRRALLSVLATRCEVQADGFRVRARLDYPMPIWIPGLGRIFGQKLSLIPADAAPLWSSLRSLFQWTGKPLPDFPGDPADLPYVRVISFSADAVDENSIGREAEE